jgi:hypothetical protein
MLKRICVKITRKLADLGLSLLPASTVRAIDLRYLERWAAARRKPVLAQMV